MCLYATVEPLSWESAFFGMASAKLNFSSPAPALTAEAMDAFTLVQARIPAQRLDLADALAGFGFRLVEGAVDLSLAVGDEPPPAQGLPLRPATPADIPALRAAASTVFAISRFRAPWYAPQDSGRFYAAWVEKAVLGTFDHQCLLALGSDGQPVGFVSLRDIGQQQARIGLLAAFPGAAGQGVGARLMAAAQGWCQQRQLTRLWVATQLGNIPALRLYQRHGAMVTDTAYWLYRGLHDSI